MGSPKKVHICPHLGSKKGANDTLADLSLYPNAQNRIVHSINHIIMEFGIITAQSYLPDLNDLIIKNVAPLWTRRYTYCMFLELRISNAPFGTKNHVSLAF